MRGVRFGRLRARSASLATGAGGFWIVFCATSGASVARSEPEIPMSCRGSPLHCEFADGAVLVGVSLASLGLSLLLTVATIVGLLCGGLPPRVSRALWAMLIAVPLLGVLGFGILLWLGGVALLFAAGRDPPGGDAARRWLPPALMFVSAVATGFAGEPLDDGGNLSDLTIGLTFSLLAVQGIGFAWLGRIYGPSAPAPDDLG